MKFLPYEPNQAWLLPPRVKDVLGADHLCIFVHEVVERLDLRPFENEYGEEGPRPYAPALTVKAWLYAYALQVTSSGRLEQRGREDLAFRYLAGVATPDHWTLNHFRTRHTEALRELFVQVVEVAESLGLAKLGHVAIDSTPVRANASWPGGFVIWKKSHEQSHPPRVRSPCPSVIIQIPRGRRPNLKLVLIFKKFQDNSSIIRDLRDYFK